MPGLLEMDDPERGGWVGERRLSGVAGMDTETKSMKGDRCRGTW